MVMVQNEFIQLYICGMALGDRRWGCHRAKPSTCTVSAALRARANAARVSPATVVAVGCVSNSC